MFRSTIHHQRSLSKGFLKRPLQLPAIRLFQMWAPLFSILSIKKILYTTWFFTIRTAKEVKEACQAVASFLLFKPSDETMLANRDYYLKLPNIGEEFFKPRSVWSHCFTSLKRYSQTEHFLRLFSQEAVNYVKRQEYELRLLLFISQEFVEVETSTESQVKNNELSFQNRSEVN